MARNGVLKRLALASGTVLQDLVRPRPISFSPLILGVPTVYVIDHPSPASPEILHRFFPRVQTTYTPTIIPSTKGETLSEIHERTAYAIAKIITDIDREWKETGSGPRAILLVAHAATNIALGRALTGSPLPPPIAGLCTG
jgi:broad specificity phosphatase PhoE